MKTLLISFGIVVIMSGMCDAEMTPFGGTSFLLPSTSEIFSRQDFMGFANFHDSAESYMHWIHLDLQVIEGVLQFEVVKWGAGKINLCVLGENANPLSLESSKCFLSFKIDF